MPRVSVVIPTYNQTNFIQQTLDSILAQTFKDYEIIVVDDGSTDSTPEILADYASRWRQIRTFWQPNQGEGAARNTGILQSQAEYIAFVDSDDVWLPTKLELQVAVLETTRGLDWVYADAYAFDHRASKPLYLFSDRARQREGAIARELALHCFIPSPTPFIRRSVFDQVGLFATLPSVADWDMWLRIAAHHLVIRIPKPLAGYRIHPGMMTRNQNTLHIHECGIAVLQRAVDFAPEAYKRCYREALAAQHVRTGRILMGRGEARAARAMFIRAIHQYPGQPRVYALASATVLGPWLLGRLIQLNHLRQTLVAGRLGSHH